MKGQTKYYMFVVYNPKMVWESVLNLSEWEWEETPTRWKAFNEVQYMVFSLERCPRTGTLHLQGYIEMKNRKRFVQIKKMFPALAGAAFEPRKGSCEEARSYCMKSDSHVAGPWEYGVWEPEKQRKDQKTKATELLVRRVREGATDPDLWEEFPSLMLIHNRSVCVARDVFTGKGQRTVAPLVFLFVGPTTQGKTTTALNIANYLGDVFHVPYPKASGLYFDGYKGQNSMFFDDFDGRYMTPMFFKKLFNKAPLALPRIGKEPVEMNSPYVFITSNYAPKYWWKKLPEADYNAIMKRFVCIRFFGPKKTKSKQPFFLFNGAPTSTSSFFKYI